ncbi:cytochrome P450 [Nocardiopsis sp. N85]|uniref:cytochrome P450 n=1 Tax=Nocardiopsis sp. N85 TaxID=3029400 RepID=UPI00237EFB1F|nr:cytochrome P450 [Nocardiopsis sp. N85]MDE3720706.1 cytochrome P450 [Nocardiopsis sp. N85]
MPESLPAPAPLSTARPRGCPFDPPAELGALRDRHPLSRMSYPDGHVGWLVTGHALARAVAADRRFSSRQELMRLPTPRNGVPAGPLPPAPPGMFVSHDAPEHTRYRRLLAGRFTVRRMRALTERVEQITAERLDAMEGEGPGVDLVVAFAQPVPALMICELLGVPSGDHGHFQRLVSSTNDQNASLEEVGAAMAELGGFLHGLVLAKRASPTDDLLGELVGEDLTDEELTNIAVLLLGAGLDTTANMIALGAFALFTAPEQIAALSEGPEAVDRAVEELLRYLTIAHTGVRTALEDVELGGHLIRAGDSVTISALAADRDPAKFTDPDVLDLRRDATGHLALGHGAHQCLGQQLARVELRVALPALFERFPTLRPAVPADEVAVREDSDIHGVYSLPVTWDEV